MMEDGTTIASLHRCEEGYTYIMAAMNVTRTDGTENARTKIWSQPRFAPIFAPPTESRRLSWQK